MGIINNLFNNSVRGTNDSGDSILDEGDILETDI
jgi:hypothetical protein